MLGQITREPKQTAERIYEIKIESFEDLAKAIKELAWQGNNSLIRHTGLVIEIWRPNEARKDL